MLIKDCKLILQLWKLWSCMWGWAKMVFSQADASNICLLTGQDLQSNQQVNQQQWSPHACGEAPQPPASSALTGLLLIGMPLEFAGNNNVTYSIIHGPVRWNQMLPLCDRARAVTWLKNAKSKDAEKRKTWWRWNLQPGCRNMPRFLAGVGRWASRDQAIV